MKRRQNDLFKLPNSIFTANLTPTQYKVIAALYSLRSHSIYKGNKYIKSATPPTRCVGSATSNALTATMMITKSSAHTSIHFPS